MTGALWAAVAWAAIAQAPGPVRVEAAVVPETVTVGDRFVYRVRVRAAAGTHVTFPAALEPTDSVEGAAPVEVRTSGDSLWTAEYEYVAWAPGVRDLPGFDITVRAPGGGTVTRTVPPHEVVVASVLPAGADAVSPRGPKDVWGRSWAWWELALLALGVALVVGGAALLWRRLRRRVPPIPRVSADPKAVARHALEALEQVGKGWLIRGEAKPYYTQLSQILRYYLEAVDERWGPDLTTAELVVRLRSDGVSSYHAFELGDILGEADLVKFAPVRPWMRDAVALTERARLWVEEFEPPPPPPPPPPEPEPAAVGVPEGAEAAEGAQGEDEAAAESLDRRGVKG